MRALRHIWLLRHGESMFNVRPRQDIDPLLFDAPLTALGRLQAQTMRPRITALGVDLIVASPLTRALQTAMIVADREPVLVEPLQREWQVNSCDVGRRTSKLRIEFPDLRFDHIPEQWWYLGKEVEARDKRGMLVEPQIVFFERVTRFAHWLHARPERRILLVGHGNFFLRFAKRSLVNCELFALTPEPGLREDRLGAPTTNFETNRIGLFEVDDATQ